MAFARLWLIECTFGKYSRLFLSRRSGRVLSRTISIQAMGYQSEVSKLPPSSPSLLFTLAVEVRFALIKGMQKKFDIILSAILFYI